MVLSTNNAEHKHNTIGFGLFIAMPNTTTLPGLCNET